MTDKKIFKKIRKTKKHLDKKHKDDFMPERLNLKALCKYHNKSEYFNQIRNRIYRATEQNEELNDYIFINIDDLENIYLDTDGIIMFREILLGYFDGNELADLMCEIRQQNEVHKFYYDFKTALKTFSTKQLKDYKQQFFSRIETGDKDICKVIIELIQAEIDSRNIIKRTLRHI